MMLKIALALIILLATCPAIASTTTITRNAHVSICLAKSDNGAAECLMALESKRDDALNRAFQRKLRELAQFDYEKWWMGSKAQKEQMLTNFKTNQHEWIKYRDGFCQLVSTGFQNTGAYGPAMLSCLLNMNLRREQELAMFEIGTDAEL